MAVPQGYKFTKTHEWVKVDGDVATIGVTEFAQSELGDITYLELPSAGTALRQSEPFGVVESVKAASDVYAPLDGEVIERNEEAIAAPDLINSSPYDQAWLVKLKLTDPTQAEALLAAADYDEFAGDGTAH